VKPKKLPKVLFVKRIVDGETEYFESDEDKESLCDSMTDWTEIGEYHLAKTSKIKGAVIEK